MCLLVMVVTAVTYLINSRLGAVLLLIAAAYYLFVTQGNLYERLLRLIVYSSAYYVFDIFGGRQRLSLCIAAIAVLCVLLTVNMLKRGAKVSVASANRIVLLMIFVAAYLLSVLSSYSQKETVFATYQLVILVYLTFIVPTSKNEELRAVNIEELLKLFIKGICAVAITLYVQYCARVLFGIRLGEVYEYNSKRVIYNVYFYSKSVLSLYLAAGMMYFFIEYVNDKKIINLIWLALLAGAIILNNSRTGLVSFAVCAVLYCIRNMKKIVSSIRVIVVLVLVAVAGMYIIQLMLESRSSLDGFADDNGRMETIVKAIELLPNYVFYGIGGSAEDYIRSSMGISIHNFFMAYLIQFGIFGGMAVNALVLSPLFDMKKKYWYYLLCVVFGGMLFANWHNVLYTVPVYLFVLLEDRESHSVARSRYYRRMN